MSEYKIVKQIVLDGKVYIETTAIMDALCAICSNEFRKWREAGMPYVVVKWKKQVKYFYNIDECQRWFAGEEFPASNEVYEKDDVCMRTYLLPTY